MSLKKSAALLALSVAVIAPTTASAGTAVVRADVAYDSRSTESNAVRNLAVGTSYDITVKGNFSNYGQSLWNQGPKAYWRTCGVTQPITFPTAAERTAGAVAGADAERIFAIPAVRGCGNLVLPFTSEKSGGLRISINPAKTFYNPAPISSNPATNTYVYRVVGQGVDPKFRIEDGSRTDNAGRLQATWAPTVIPSA
ncbi:MAG: hypothetical protein Q7T55_23740 [Solirubrobacteraceae bacterium]|nr:hypothetical protein [Solirubrobacteraceae bacterium]